MGAWLAKLSANCFPPNAWRFHIMHRSERGPGVGSSLCFNRYEESS